MTTSAAWRSFPRFSPQVLSEETSGGRLKFKTIKSEETKSILLIYDADLLHSGKYSCYPSNTEIASIRVHVLQGEFSSDFSSYVRYSFVAFLWAKEPLKGRLNWMLKFDNVDYTFMHLLDLDLYALNLHLARSLLVKLLRNL